MTTPIKKPRIPANKRTRLNRKNCKSCPKTASVETCMLCIMNMLVNNTNYALKNSKLSIAEQLAELDLKLEGYTHIPNLFLHVIDVLKDQKKNLEAELLRQSVHEKLNGKEKSDLNGSIPVKAIIKIPVVGKKKELGKKLGLFYFNPSNKHGLHLPKKYHAEVIELFCTHFESEDGTQFSRRTTLDNLLFGAIQELDEDLD